VVQGIDRVKIWNSYLLEAREFADKLKNRLSNTDIPSVSLEGGTLYEEEHYIIMTIIHSVLAAEARTNHLLHDLKDEDIIDERLRDVVLRSRLTTRWALLPRLAGKEHELDYAERPHQAISELDGYRNQLIHVIYKNERFIEELPSKSKTIGLYNDFVEAMEDMNVKLDRHKKKDKTILSKLKV
jgi:hypothetical protein